MYEIVFDELVIEKDFKSISLPDRKKIIRAVKNKLAADPIKTVGSRLPAGR